VARRSRRDDPIVLAEAGPIVGIVEVYKRPIGLSAHIRAGR